MTPITQPEAQQTLDAIVGFVANLKTELAIKDAWALQNHFQKLAQFITAQTPPNETRTS